MPYRDHWEASSASYFKTLIHSCKNFFSPQNKVIYTGCRFGPRICGWPSSCVSWWKPQIWALNTDPWLTGDIPLLWLRKASWPARWRASCLTWHQKLLAQKMILTLTEDFPLWPSFIWFICPNVSDFIITALLIHSLHFLLSWAKTFNKIYSMSTL